MIKILSLFSGLGAFEKALEREKIPFEVVYYSEIDKHASKAYSLVHGIDESKNLGDITKIDIDSLPSCDMIVHGSPCTDFSTVGKQRGGDAGSGTQSSLMWYSVRIIEKLLPKYVIWENVPNVVSKKHKHNFDKYLNELKSFGYTNSYAILNAVDYGVPQNRKRIYCVSILHGTEFVFPKGDKKEVHFDDILEKEVPERYYLSEDKTKDMIPHTAIYMPNTIHRLGILPHIPGLDWCKRVYGVGGVCPTLTTCDGGHRTPKIGSTDGIREITPLECFRLMGFDDEDFYKLDGYSNRQLKILAGNSIVVNVLQAIFRELIV